MVNYIYIHIHTSLNQFKFDSTQYFLSLGLMRCIFPRTRQFTLLTRQCLCPLVRLVQLDNRLLGPFCLTNTDCYFLSLPKEMHFCTRQVTLSTRQCFFVFTDLYDSRTNSATVLLPYKIVLDISLVSLIRCIFSLDNSLKPATHLAILHADRCDRRKSPGVPGAAIAIFADRRDGRIKSPISGMSEIGD